MGKDFAKQNSTKGFAFLKGFIIEIVVAAFFVTAFAFVIYVFEAGYKYASVFATVSVALGTFAAGFFTAGKIGNKGWLSGLIIGAATFILITLVSLVVDKGILTFNTLFHFIIIMLSSLIGAVLGVNKSNSRKYI